MREKEESEKNWLKIQHSKNENHGIQSHHFLAKRSRCTVLDARGWCTGMTQREGRGGRREEGSGWETRVYLWWIHFDIWQN